MYKLLFIAINYNVSFVTSQKNISQSFDSLTKSVSSHRRNDSLSLYAALEVTHFCVLCSLKVPHLVVLGHIFSPITQNAEFIAHSSWLGTNIFVSL